MKRTDNLLLLVLVIFSAGCVPVQFTSRPGASGTLVNARTGSPIRSALVTVQAGTERASTTTGADGAFRVPPETHWEIHLFGDYHPFPGLLSIEHPGFRPVHKEVPYNAMNPIGGVEGNFGTIRTEPNSR